LFSDFPIFLDEWLQRLAKNNVTFFIVVLKSLTLELIHYVNTISNHISFIVDFWMGSVLGGYIIEFFIGCTLSYGIVERELFKGPKRIYLKSLSNWINMMLFYKGVMKLESDHPSI
jgi:hypothetical protein